MTGLAVASMSSSSKLTWRNFTCTKQKPPLHCCYIQQGSAGHAGVGVKGCSTGC